MGEQLAWLDNTEGLYTGAVMEHKEYQYIDSCYINLSPNTQNSL